MERASKRARVETNGVSHRRKPHLPPEVISSIWNHMGETPLSLSLVSKEWRSLYLKKKVFGLHVLPPKREISAPKKKEGPPAVLKNATQQMLRKKRKKVQLQLEKLSLLERRKFHQDTVDKIYKFIRECAFSVHTLDFHLSEISNTQLNKIFKCYLKREAYAQDHRDDLAVKDFVGLRWLSLRGCSEITNAGLKNLPATVTYLDISFKRVKGGHLKGPLIDREGFRYLPSTLHTLNVQYSYYVDKRDFQYLPQRLHTLVWTQESDNIPPSHTVAFPKDLATLQMPISTFADISSLPVSLKKLRITRIGSNIRDQAFQFCSTVKKLDFSNCPEDMNGRVLPFLPTNLRSLNLSRCYKLTDLHVFSLPVSLKALDLTRSGITNRTLDNLKLSALTNLHKLVLQETEVTDNGLRFINAPSLHELDLSLNNMTDAGLPFLPTTLRKLDLSCTDVTSKGLTSYLPKSITILNVYGCPNLTGDAIYHLPQLRLINARVVTHED